MKFTPLAILLLLGIVTALSPSYCQKTSNGRHSKAANELSDIFIKIADPGNEEFEDFKKHFGKVIDVLNPKTPKEKIPKRLDKLVVDMDKGVSSYHKRRGCQYSHEHDEHRTIPASKPATTKHHA